LAFAIGSLSIIGLPPFGGLWSKWYLAMATIDTGHWILLGVLLVSSLLNIAYLLVIPMRAFFSGPATADTTISEAPTACLIAMSITSIACVVLFFYPDFLYNLARLAAGQ
jgi:multicomponent Na+:H+ antiporter subunit D